MTQVTNSFEGGTDTVDISAANSGGASGDAFNSVPGTTAPKYSATQAAHGSLSGRFQTVAAGTHYLNWSTAAGTLTDHYGRVYVYLDIGAATNIGIVRFLEFRAASLACFIRPAGTGRLTELADSAGSIAATGSTAWAKNQWMRIEWHIVHSTTVGTIDVRVYNTPDSTTIDETVSASGLNLGANATSVRIGVTTSVANWPVSGGFCYMDDLVYGATSWPGPAAGGAPAERPIGIVPVKTLPPVQVLDSMRMAA